MAEETNFGIELDGNFLTLVESLEGVAVSSRSHYFEDIEEGLKLITVGLKKGKKEPRYRVVSAVPKSAMRRIDVTKKLLDRKNFENYVYEKTSANRDLTTLAGMFFEKNKIDGENITPGVAVLSPSDRVEKIYNDFKNKDIELVLPSLTYGGFNGIWLAIRYEVCDVTLIENGRPVAYRQLVNSGGLAQLLSILGDVDNPELGAARLEATLSRSGVTDPLAESELDRFLRKIVVELVQTLKYWENSGEAISNQILVFGPGARTKLIDKALSEAGLKRVIPKQIQENLALLPLEERDAALGALCASATLGFNMPEVAFINVAKAKMKEERGKLKDRNKLIKIGSIGILIAGLSYGAPYLLGEKNVISSNSRLEKAQSENNASIKNIKMVKEFSARKNYVNKVLTNEADWQKVLEVSFNYAPNGLVIESLQAGKEKGTITVSITSTVPGNSYNIIAKWLDNIKSTGGASSAWMSSFAFANGKTTSQITYTVPLSKVKILNPNTNGVSSTSQTESTIATNTNPGSVSLSSETNNGQSAIPATTSGTLINNSTGKIAPNNPKGGSR